MKNKIPYLHKMTVIAMLVIALVFALSQVLLVWNFYETDVYLYAHGTRLPDIFNIALAVFVILDLLLFLIFKKDQYPDSLAKTSGITVFFGAASGLALICSGAYGLYSFMQQRANPMHIVQRQDNFTMWAAIVSVVAFLYFAVTAFSPEKNVKLRAWLGCAAIVWHILYLLSIYFDMSNPLNNPIRLISQFALVAAMIYLVVEIRFLLGIPKKGFYISASVIAFTLLLASSLSNIVCTIGGKLPLTDAMFGYAYQLMMVGYVLSRLISQLRHEETIKKEDE